MISRPSNNYGDWLWRTLIASFLVTVLQLTLRSAEKLEAIDMNRARQIHQRFQKGESVSADERAYLERAKIAMETGRRLFEKRRSGQTLTAEETSFLESVTAAFPRGASIEAVGDAPSNRPAASGSGAPRDNTGLVPLDQMSKEENYKGQPGGLYGAGRNQPSPEWMKAAQTEAAKIVPLDGDGKRSPEGKIVMLSIGMSNTTQEYSKFKQLADGDPEKSPALVLVDGAQGGKDAAQWSDEAAGAGTWNVANERLRAAGVTPLQVQAIWMKHARIQPARFGEFPKHAEELRAHILKSLQIAKRRFPNLRIAYLSSRIYAGYASTQLNPEPYAYESAFAVRSLILDQIGGSPGLNFDSTKGAVNSPLLLWGPYLWADGKMPRKSDGLGWNREDLAGDGTHPSPTSGREKVAKMLLTFFKSDPTTQSWFLRRKSN